MHFYISIISKRKISNLYCVKRPQGDWHHKRLDMGHNFVQYESIGHPCFWKGDHTTDWFWIVLDGRQVQSYNFFLPYFLSKFPLTKRTRRLYESTLHWKRNGGFPALNGNAQVWRRPLKYYKFYSLICPLTEHLDGDKSLARSPCASLNWWTRPSMLPFTSLNWKSRPSDQKSSWVLSCVHLTRAPSLVSVFEYGPTLNAFLNWASCSGLA